MVTKRLATFQPASQTLADNSVLWRSPPQNVSGSVHWCPIKSSSSRTCQNTAPCGALLRVKDPKTGKHHGVGVINVANEGIYPVLDTLVGELCEVFQSSPYIHTGGDEYLWPEFLKTEEAQQYMKQEGMDLDRLQTYFRKYIWARSTRRPNNSVASRSACSWKPGSRS